METRQGRQNPVIVEVVTTPGDMESMGVTLLKGRFFDEQDGETEVWRVVIVNESFADNLAGC